MGYNLDEFIKISKEVRKLFYNDNYVCNKIDEYDYDTYISDNTANHKVLDDALAESGIKLVIAPTGSGKSSALLDSAKRVSAVDKDCLFVFALPSRPLAEQLANGGIERLVGGDEYEESMKIVATTYEKIFEIKQALQTKKQMGKPKKAVLILDECHLLASQNLFRQKAIQDLISCIEENLFHSVLLVTATPFPMSLFRCERIINFKSLKSKPVMDKIEIIEINEIIGHIKNNIDYGKEFPFIRLCDTNLIDNLIDKMPQKIARLTSTDKKSKVYQDIVNHSKIDATGIDGILTTSLLEAGVSIREYPENTVPYVAFPNFFLSVDDIEQFLNRLRRSDNYFVVCAKILLKKLKEKELSVSLASFDRKEACTFHDLSFKDGMLHIRDTSSLDSVPDGEYLLITAIDEKREEKPFTVTSSGRTNAGCYSKADKKEITIEVFKFRKFIDILRTNLFQVEKFCSVLSGYSHVLEQAKADRLAANASDILDLSSINESELVDEMIKSAITRYKFCDCLTYDKKEIVINKRILYMLSYNEYERQFYYNHNALKEELEQRLNIPVEIKEESAAKTKIKAKKPDEKIWDGIEDIRQYLIDNGCSKYLYDKIMHGDPLARQFKKYREELNKVREQEELLELMKSLSDSGIGEDYVLQILTKSETKRDVEKYKKYYHILTMNKSLLMTTGTAIQKVPCYTDQQRMQAAIYYHLNSKNQDNYTFANKGKDARENKGDELLNEINAYYRQCFPNGKKYTPKQIRQLILQMYCVKDKKIGKIRNILKTDYNAIFK